MLEPLNDTFGRISIFSGYRSPSVNQLCNEKKLNCANNEKNYASHIFDYSDQSDEIGATASIVIPAFADLYEKGEKWQSLAWWIHDNLPYSTMQFFPKLAAFNIGWHKTPKKQIYSFIAPDKGWLTKPGMDNHQGDHSAEYESLLIIADQ